ncbi:MAG: ethanolamine ammonia-lyase reactivating factor EutA [Oscillospiraceae bacterium]|nr:ethanolamine ammonia-lyase reactivating factor EutA [Oscillospiraceae bacterium]
MIGALTSVGLDVGTTTTSLIVSRLTVQDQASAFAVPDLQIRERKILYESPVHFTPLIRDELIDGMVLRQIVETEYRNAGIRREDVDTGAVIITGETSRKENARSVAEALSDIAGDFVVATAGPDLESVLAAQGSGAVDWSQQTGQAVLHMDIGGGTSNLAWIREGEIVATSCLDVGGRLLKFDPTGCVTYVSPVLEGLTDLRPGDRPARSQLEDLTALLTSVLEMAAGLRPATALLQKLTTATTLSPPSCQRSDVAIPRNDRTAPLISFSGGVAECIRQDLPPMAFGDMGPLLGKAIRHSRLYENARLGDRTIRATVIGAGCHSAQLSGSTVFHRGISFPLKGLPTLPLDPETDLTAQIREGLAAHDATPVLALPGWPGGYRQIAALADLLAASVPSGPVLVTTEQDMAKALGQALALRLPPDRPILCLDRLQLTPHSYLDVAAPIGPALPVIIKTLIFSPARPSISP